MENIKTISCGAIIHRTETLFGIKDSSWRADAIEWVGEAIQGIGYHVGFVTEPKYVIINDFRAALPKGLFNINYIEYNGHRLPLGVDKSDYGYHRKSDKGLQAVSTYQEVLLLNKEIDRLNILQTELQTDPTNQSVINAIIDSNFKITTMVQQFRLAEYAQYAKEFYNIDGPYIKCSFPTGEIKINGEWWRLDENGYPEVIDTFKYTKAVEWYLISCLLLRGYKHPTIDWKIADQKWDGEDGKGFRVQASNEAKMPSIDQMERFSQRWQGVTREADLKHELNFLQ